jgi:hypothetical protein
MAFVIACAVVDGLLMQTLIPLLTTSCESFVFLILLIVSSAQSIALGRGQWRSSWMMDQANDDDDNNGKTKKRMARLGGPPPLSRREE